MQAIEMSQKALGPADCVPDSKALKNGGSDKTTTKDGRKPPKPALMAANENDQTLSRTHVASAQTSAAKSSHQGGSKDTRSITRDPKHSRLEEGSRDSALKKSEKVKCASKQVVEVQRQKLRLIKLLSRNPEMK